jgi:hypothetical protein
LQKYIGSVQGKVNDNEISETFDFVIRTCLYSSMKMIIKRLRGNFRKTALPNR